MNAPDRPHVLRCRWCDGPHVVTGSTSARVLDVLGEDTTRIWWTIPALAHRINRKLPTTRRTVYRLLDADLIRRGTTPTGELEVTLRSRPNAPDRSWPATVTYGYLCSCGAFLPDPHRIGVSHVLSAHHADHVTGGAA